MSKRVGLIIVFGLLFLAVSAQETWNYAAVDKKSHELYQKKKWAELIKYSNDARNHGIDFFYLQARSGIAYYNLKLYRKSTKWFLKAYENDQSFEWLQEYLYYSLVFGGRTTEALKYAKNFTPAFQQKINYAPAKISRIAFEGGYSFNPDFDKIKGIAYHEQLDVGDNYGEAYFLENYHFESFDLSHQLAPGVSINHNFTYLGLNKEEQVYWGSQNEFPIKVNQFQYFINPYFVLGKKWYVSPSVSIVWGNTELYLGNYDPNTFYVSSLKYSDFIYTTSSWSHFGNFSPGAEINFANIFDVSFTQMSAWICYYPFSNTNFYITPRVYFRGDKAESLGYNTFEVSGGIQLGPVHLYGKYLNGDMRNFIESAGYVISNFPGSSDQKIMGSLYFPTGKKYQFVFRYINQNITENYQVYTSGVKSNSLEYNYVKHTITAGISWNF
ncbi:hypothetical protein GM418_12165 [Maribellus comscasis]|uniref:Uncharacterized protein n=1 Tax=Maribellus comscasis TaxID=2681766 RepID=A0A6I6K379_9BACT|nr:hypothetical protein [Maribellus comscasis]QGY44384.1 hypothetical protein GM418_12165 [Maribellus comscasis]